MKKITFTLLSIILLTTISYSQTVNTPIIELSDTAGLEYYAQIEISSTMVTLTLIGPSDRWLGLGFDATSMTSGKDMVLFDGTNLTDRSFVGVGSEPVVDAQEDWTITSNTINSGVRTLIATRDSNGGPGDHKFSTSDTSIDLVWARERTDIAPTFLIDYHGFTNKGITMADFHPLSLDDHKISTFSISPNPGRARLNLKLSRLSANTNLEVFDVLGKKIYANRLTDVTSSIDVSKWNSGVYLVRVSNDSGVQTKRFVKQ